MMVAVIRHQWTSLWLLITTLCAFLLYLYGFFPLRYHSGKISHLNDLPNFIDGVSIDSHEVYKNDETSVILMVIDGLRYDFISSEYMPFTDQLIVNTSACIHVAIAEPPTVTMPRIKAMMTGSVSTFADVALNFGAPAVRGDSVLRAATARGRRTVIYGDDTWIRLFPGLWSEHDGTTSFYVTDYTEVDNNVTRHLDKVLTMDEKKKPTFDFLVLHYLGLDHIGHLEGARSPKIKPKLIEMDNIIKKIYAAVTQWDHRGVIFVCGDHGMRDAGGHGGATSAEVLVPLVVIDTHAVKCPYQRGQAPTIAQVDMAPTISWLLNAAIPGDSIGRFIPELLPYDVRQRLFLMHVVGSQNAKDPALPTDKEFFKQFKRAEKQFAQYLATGQKSAANIALEFYEESLEKMTKYLTDTVTKFDVFAIFAACICAHFVTLTLFNLTIFSLQSETAPSVPRYRRYNAGTILAFAVVLATFVFIYTLACFITETESPLCTLDPLWTTVSAFVPLTLTATYFITKSAVANFHQSPFKGLNSIDYFLLGGSAFHAWSFFGTSFIEEEHMTWYFFWNTLMFLVLLRNIVTVVIYFTKKWSGSTEVQEKPELERRISVGISIFPKWVLLIALHRYLRTMNQTGDRWLFLPDTADWLNAPENAFYLEAHLVVGTLLTFGICIYNLKYMNNILYLHTAFTILSLACILCYRIATNALFSTTTFVDIKTWDPVHIVNFFWGILIIQVIFEILTYIGGLKRLGCAPQLNVNKNFSYNKPKAKTEDYYYDEMAEPWNVDEVRLSLVRSISHIMLNDMMLIIILLMRPHNVIMVPSIYITCLLTSKCLDHKLLAKTVGKDTEIVDTLSQTLVYHWIGMLFFFYQGNSNSLASVDLGSGYVGLREYCPVRVAFRMGLHAYAGPALAGAQLFCAVAATSHCWEQYLQSVWRVANIMALQRSYQVFAYCTITYFFRDHLFVWTVFSPKLLYEFVATVFSVQALTTIANIIILTRVASWLAKMIAYKKI